MKFVGIVTFAFASSMSTSGMAAPGDVCRGQLVYVYPSGTKLYAQYYVDNRQRAWDCFISQCAAPCAFPTAVKPKRASPLPNDPKSGPKSSQKAASDASN